MSDKRRVTRLRPVPGQGGIVVRDYPMDRRAADDSARHDRSASIHADEITRHNTLTPEEKTTRE